jgi:hypothetical protein
MISMEVKQNMNMPNAFAGSTTPNTPFIFQTLNTLIFTFWMTITGMFTLTDLMPG